MPKFVQEKFQVNEPNQDYSYGNAWASFESAHTAKGTPYGNSALFNSLPPGMDIEDQETSDQRVFNKSIAGNYPVGHNAGDPTQDCTEKSVKSGFDRKPCCPTDDMYTREHNDAFYDDPEVDGQHGFAERNNYLDRL